MSFRNAIGWVFFFLPGLSAAGASGEVPDSVFSLEEVTVFSSRLAINGMQTGKHVRVIGAAEIGKLPVSSVDELLRQLPMMEVQSRGAFGVQSDITLRGSTFNQVLVLIDGMRMNDPLTGHFNGYVPVPLTEIMQIEIYPGPASAIYGPDAVGGVVNVITKSFAPGRGTDRLEGQVSAQVGENRLRSTNSGIYLQHKNLRAGGGILWNKSDGHTLGSDSARGDFNLGTASLSLAYEINDQMQVSIRTAFDKRLFNAQNFYTLSSFDQSREEVKKWWNQVRFRYRINSKNTSELQMAYISTRDSFLFNPSFQANIHTTDYRNLQWNHYYQSGRDIRMTFGIQGDTRSIISSDRGSHERWHAGAYLTGFWERDNWMLSPSIRIDYDRAYQIEFLPQLSASYVFGKLLLRALAGRTIRTADFTENYISNGLPGPLTSGRNLGNPNLLPEKSWSFEAGADYQPGIGMMFKTTVFYRYSRDLIDYIYTAAANIPEADNLDPGGSYFFARNISELNTYGIENEIISEHQLQKNLKCKWGIAYRFTASDNDSSEISKYIASHARHLINGNFGIQTDRLSVSINGLYKNRVPEIASSLNRKVSSDYMVWNTRLGLYFFDNRLEGSLSINNLFKIAYSDILGALMPGRWIMAGITWRFGKAF